MPFERERVNLSLAEWPVDKLEQNCVESEDLCGALRYDPPFRLRSFDRSAAEKPRTAVRMCVICMRQQ